MTDIELLGDICSPIVFVSGDINNDLKLDVGEKWIYRCTASLTKTTKNSVVAIGLADGLTASHITNATVVVGVSVTPPLIHVTKIPSPLVLPVGGGMVVNTITVTNPGVVALSGVWLKEDSVDNNIQFVSGDINNDRKLDPSETWIYTNRVRVDKTITNTVIASGIANGLAATDFAVATVVVSAVPKLPNTGESFLRDLKIGTVGADVKDLQKYLNANGYKLSSSGVGSPGHETNYFGRLTQSALIKFQKDKSISPAVGYFGPITRKAIGGE